MTIVTTWDFHVSSYELVRRLRRAKPRGLVCYPQISEAPPSRRAVGCIMRADETPSSIHNSNYEEESSKATRKPLAAFPHPKRAPRSAPGHLAGTSLSQRCNDYARRAAPPRGGAKPRAVSSTTFSETSITSKTPNKRIHCRCRACTAASVLVLVLMLQVIRWPCGHFLRRCAANPESKLHWSTSSATQRGAQISLIRPNCRGKEAR